MDKTLTLYWNVARSKWPVLIALPAVNGTLVIAFWQSQLFQYAHSTNGILYMWLVAGLLFVLIQLSLQVGAWRAAAILEGDKQKEVRWSLGSQIGLFGLAAVYNAIALIQLYIAGVRPVQPFDLIIASIVVATLAVAIVYYRKRLSSPESRLLIATGTKAAPQWLQAGWFIIQGSLGMHFVTILSILAMGGTRYMMTHHAAKQFDNPEAQSANKAAFRDFISIIAMGIGWLIGRL